MKIIFYKFQKNEVTLNLEVADNEKANDNRKDLVDVLKQAIIEIEKDIV